MNRKLFLILFFSLTAFCSDAQSLWSGTNYSNQKKSGSSTVNLLAPCPQPWCCYIPILQEIIPAGAGMILDSGGVYLPSGCTCDGDEVIFTFISPRTTTYHLYQLFDLGLSYGVTIGIRQTDSTCSFNNFQLLYCDSAVNDGCVTKLNLDSGASYDIIVDFCCDSYFIASVALSIVIPEIKNIKISDVNPDSLTVSWDSIQGDVVVEYGPKDFTLGSGTKILNPSNPFIIGGLTPHTVYDFYVYQLIDTIKSCFIERNRLTTPYRCDSTPYVYCDNTYIKNYFDGYASKDAWTFTACSNTSCVANANEKVFQFIPDSTGMHNFSHSYQCCGQGDVWSAYYKEASNGCNDQNWNFIDCGQPNANWNADFGPLISGKKYYLLIAGLKPQVFSCNYSSSNNVGNFWLSGPSPVCSQPPSGLSSNANNNTICLGDSTQIFPVGSMLSSSGFYIWRKDSCSGSYISNKKVITVSPTVATTYFLQIADSCGTISCDSITISVNPNPILSLTNDTTICYNDSLLLSLNSSGFAAVQWMLNAVVISGATDTIYYANQVGDYYATVIDSLGCKGTSNSISLAKSIPVTTINPNGYVNICDGDSVSLTAVNIPGYSFQWFYDNTILNGVTNYSIMVSDSGNYFATIIDTLQCSANSDTIKITVSKLPDVTLSPAGIISNFVGNYLTLNAQSDSLNSFQWYRNGTLLPYAQSVTCHAYSSGVYLVRVTDSLGCFNYSQTLQLNGISNNDNNGVSTQRSFNDSTYNMNQIGVFPNPTNGITTIDLSNLAGKNFSVSMSSATGQLIFNHEKYKQQVLFIDAAQLSKGVYTLKIAGEVNGYKKIIVN